MTHPSLRITNRNAKEVLKTWTTYQQNINKAKISSNIKIPAVKVYYNNNTKIIMSINSKSRFFLDSSDRFLKITQISCLDFLLIFTERSFRDTIILIQR